MVDRRVGFHASVACALAMLLLATFASAQGSLGRLAGTVLDSSGGVLPGATVTLTNVQTNQSATAVTTDTGAFVFPQLQPGMYKVVVELQGFKTASFSDVQINVGQEYSLTARLAIGQLSETVEVTGASSPLVQTTTPEIVRTVEQKQILLLPVVNRDMTQLIRLQAGVPGISTRMNTGINGGRPTWTQVTQDGINVQDNFIRTNSLDFLPNRPSSDNVGEFSITTSVQGADSAGGASSVRMVTPSGTNRLRGSAFWQNRDNALAANSFFNNKSGVPKPLLKQNQFGGSSGGPIMKDKLFFFGYYEGFRRKQAGAQNVTVAANPDTFSGVWRYVSTSDGQVRSVNIVQAVGATLDPKMQQDVFTKIASYSNVNNYDRGDSRSDRILNTAGYRWDQNRQTVRNYYGGRADYELSTKHRFEGIFTYSTDLDDRPDLDFISLDRPQAYTSSPVKRFVGAWRWMVSSTLTNEVRAGANLAPVKFEVYPDALPAVRFAGQTATLPLTLQDPQINFFPQGRFTNTYQFNDNASWMKGNHAMQMGASWQRIHVNPYNYEATVPTIGWGFSSAAPGSAQLNSGMFPGGISAADLSSANTMLAMLTGTISQVSTTFQVKDQNSGYVSGYPNDRKYTLDTITSYFQDNWRLKSNLTVRAGLKWEYNSPVSEDSNLGFMPVLNGQSYTDVLANPNTTISFINGGMWKKDLNNFGPNAGISWDLTSDGRTAVRGGYSLTFVNEEGVTVATNTLGGNAGLTSATTLSSLYTSYNAGVPTIPTPTFLTTRTLANQMTLSASAPMATVNPDIQQPQVHQVSVGISRELPWRLAGEARYVGSFGRGIWKGINYNQIKLNQPFIDDFSRARSNGYLSVAAGGAFDPAYNANIPGSQPLTVLPTYGGGFLTNSTVRTAIQQNEVAGVADFYVTSRVAGALAAFYPNPGIYDARAVVNDGRSDYNALQLELRRQYKDGIMGQVNYTFSHNRSNSGGGNLQSRFEPYLDNARPQLDAGRSSYNITHVVNANLILELPFGQGKKWLNQGGVSNAILGGWQISGVIHYQSGSPVGIYSTRGTFNTAGRSGLNTAVTATGLDDISKLFGVFKTANGNIYWINPSVIGTDGRAVGADNLANAAGFSGQVFFNPVANQVGSLPILAFNAPSVYQVDALLAKRFTFAKRYTADFRIEAFNVFNSVSFYSGDMNINSTTFGRITGVAVGARIVQLTARLTF